MSWSSGIYEPIKDHTQEKSYLVQNQDVRGVGEPYAVPATFREASLPVDPTKIYGSVTTLSMAAIPSPIIGKYIQLPDGTLATPALSWASDTDSGFYKIATDRYGYAINGVLELEINTSGILIPDLTVNRVVLAGTGGQLRDDADLTYSTGTNLFTANSRAIIGVDLQVGTATDSDTAGDVVFGLLNASRLFFDVSTQSLFQYDSSNNADFKINVAGDSWYNGSGNFGFGTTAPDQKVEITSSSGTQLRISHTDSNNSYVTFGADSSGNLYITPWTGGMIMNTASDTLSGPVFFEITNADSPGGNAQVELAVLDTAGDAKLLFEVASVTTTWSLGVDNSDSDKFKISFGSVLGTTDAITIDVARLVTISNSTATTVPLLDQTQASTGDAATRWALGSTISYALGIDNSVSGDPFVLSTAASASAALGTGNILSITSGGLATWSRSDSATTPTHDLIQSSTGDTAIRWALSTTISYILGIDNSASDAFVLSTAASGSAALGTGDLLSISSAGAVLIPAGDLTVSRSSSGADVKGLITNSSNTASSNALLHVSCGGSSAGDAATLYTVTGTTNWIIGIDNSDSDKFKICAASALGTNDFLVINNSGTVEIGAAGAIADFRTTSITFNDARADSDLLIKGDNSAVLFKTDAGLDAVQIGNAVAGDIADFRATVVVFNEGGADKDQRVESDDEAYCFMVEGTLNNLVFCANAEPAFQNMDGGLFLSEANVVPTGNPTAGVYIYVEGGALKCRGTGGTITTMGPA